MHKRLITLVTAMLITTTLGAKTHAIVNGEPLTDADVKPMLSLIKDAKDFDSLNDNEKKMILDQSIEKKLILQAAKKEKIEESVKFQQVLNDFKNRLMVEYWMRGKFDAITVSDTDINDYFSKHKENLPKDTTLESIKTEIAQKAKMEKFQLLIDQMLSRMKQEAKIEYK